MDKHLIRRVRDFIEAALDSERFGQDASGISLYEGEELWKQLDAMLTDAEKETPDDQPNAGPTNPGRAEWHSY